MATKASKLSTEELLSSPKITPGIEKEILGRLDFSRIQPTYCEKVCKLKCKKHELAQVVHTECDVLIIQDHLALPGKFDRRPNQQEDKLMEITTAICRNAGFSGLTYRVLTLLKCAPSNADFIGNKPPKQSTLMKCAPYLWAEITAAKPKVIISTSTACTKALGLAGCSNKNDRGKVIQSQFGPIVISQHPRILTYIRQNAVNASSGYWSADFYGVILRDFIKAARIARGELRVLPLADGIGAALEHNIVICRSTKQVLQYTSEILSLPENTLVSWDIETTGLSGWKKDARLLCTQFGFRRPGSSSYTSVVIPLWHRCNTTVDVEIAWDQCKLILEGPTKKIGWNVKFDRVYTAASTGVLAQNIVLDGLLAYHMMDSGINGCYSLKSATVDFMPESGLAGYEDQLPKLTKKVAEGDFDDEDETLEETE